jgi:hypothetical protein
MPALSPLPGEIHYAFRAIAEVREGRLLVDHGSLGG